ncbi:uncharacterized protein LOC110898240 [Helianthus annuus]|uniref:uncharacterized protein LOC110898240 n=1 Tax=Helianthus annuus TaxID=4232 RepID=UPI000B904C2B|nr:uncharacterized protein LOC110898240 [Helianthus annuus]
MALAFKGVMVGDTRCQRCGLDNETAKHILTSCLMTKTIWRQVLIWIKLPMSPANLSIGSLAISIQNLHGSTKWKKTIGVIFLATCWEIWCTRNKNIFNNVYDSTTVVVERIKEEDINWGGVMGHRTLRGWGCDAGEDDWKLLPEMRAGME